MSTKTSRFALRIRETAAPLLLVILMINLAGCAPVPTEALPTSIDIAVIPTATPTTSPTQTPVPTPTQTPFVPKATIKIVVHVPLSGGQSNYGTDIMRAAELAVQQLAGPLIELGYKIELVHYDDQANTEIGVANAKEIVANPEILCGVGHYTSRVTIQASEIYHREGLAFISPSNTSTTVTDRGYLEVNRMVGRDDGQGVAGARFAHEQGFISVYMIGNNGAYSEKIAEYFKREADRIGVKVVGTVTTDAKEKFDVLIKRMMDANPDLVYFAGRADQAGPFFKEARAAGYMGTFLSIDGANSPTLAELAGPLLVEGGGMYYTEMAAPAGYYPNSKQFVQDFLLYYGSFPQLYAAEAYDAAGICMKAIEEASKAKGGEMPTRAEVATAIRALKDYKGITGTYNFNKRGDPILAKYFVFKAVAVDPHDWGLNAVVGTLEVEPPN